MPHNADAVFDRARVKTAVAHWAIECGSQVQKRRKSLGISRKVLAELGDTSEPTITRIESGSLNPRDDLRWIIAGIMQCEVTDLWPTPSRQDVADLRESA